MILPALTLLAGRHQILYIAIFDSYIRDHERADCHERPGLVEADTQILAQALAENIPIVAVDAKFSLYAGVQVIW